MKIRLTWELAYSYENSHYNQMSLDSFFPNKYFAECCIDYYKLAYFNKLSTFMSLPPKMRMIQN